MNKSIQDITALLRQHGRVHAVQANIGSESGEGHLTCASSTITGFLSVKVAPGDSLAAVSLSQRGMWFVQRMDPDTRLYNYAFTYHLRGPLEISRLIRVLEELVARHEALRTTFHELDGEPVQLIHATWPVEVRVEDISEIPVSDRESHVLRNAVEERPLAFDLAKGPLVRFALYHNAEDEVYAVLHWHHLIMDGMAFKNLWTEFGTIHEALRSGTNLPNPVQQPADIGHAQRALLQGEFLESQLAYWREHLSGTLPRLDLPLDKARPVVQSHTGRSSKIFSVPQEIALPFKALTEQENTRLYASMLAAFYILLYRYTGNEDMVIGFPVACRKNPPAWDVVGHFVNLLPFRTHLHGELSFREVLARVRETITKGLAHQFVPLDLIVNAVNPPRVTGRGILFDAVFAFQSVAVYEMSFGDIKMKRIENDPGMAHADLMAWIEDRPDGFYGWFDFDTDLFEKPTIDAMVCAYTDLIATLTREPDKPIGALSLTPWDTTGLAQWNDTGMPFSSDQTLADLVTEWAERDPQRAAVGNEQVSYTYAMLDGCANQIAHHLLRLGATREQTVVLALESGPDLIVALLGILKAGCTFLAIDTAYPAERLSFMLEDSGCRFVLATSETAGRLPDHTACTICLDVEASAIAKEPTTPVTRRATPSTLAYIIYTSGSTGRPKGVGIEHAGLTSFACWLRDQYPLTRGERVLQFASPSFDAFVLETAWAMASGAELRFVDWETRRSPEWLAQHLQKEQIAGTLLPPAMLRLMPTQGLDALRILFTGGDVCSVDLVAKWAQGRDFYNAYGPSECTIAATVHKCLPEQVYHSVPIGRAIGNTRLYVVDTQLQPVPPGMPGELCIAGICVGRGYLNRPELTAERFVVLSNGERVYRTGDRVRFLPNGEVEFMGRTDWQVKVRGFRIELEEIEALLRGCLGVQDAAVAAVDDAAGEKQLAAYVVAPGIEAETLRGALRNHLPAFMIPGAFLFLDALPLAASGKVDRKALPAPSFQAVPVAGIRIAPRTAVEERVAVQWKDVMKSTEVGVSEHFFDCGGSSLLLVQLLSRLNREFSVTISIREAFENPTIAALAAMIERLQSGESPLSPVRAPEQSPLVVVMRDTGTRPPLFLLPPAGGVNTAYYALGRELGVDQPVYSFYDPYVLRDGKPCNTIEEAAAYYADAIKAIHPEGCHYLMGWSFGATMALEVAQVLGTQYGDPTCVIMLDPAPARASKPTVLSMLHDWYDIGRACIVMVIPSLRETWDHAFVLVSTERRKQAAEAKRPSLRKRWRALMLGLMWNTVLKHADVGEDVAQEARLALIEQPNAKAFRRIMRANWAALLHYRPRPFSGRLVLLQGEEQSKERLIRRFVDAIESLTTGRVERHLLFGHHYSLLRRPSVTNLARLIRNCMDDVEEE